jgi:DNA-binding HxlR family transcriptional regulator
VEKTIIDAIDYINEAVNKSEQFKNYSPEMSSKVLDNRIITLEAYIKFIERETIPTMENLVEMLEEEDNG